MLPGSSPLTRGKHPGRSRCRSRDRLIPAHAGKTRGTARRHRGPEAHPRSRGENLGDRPDDYARIGSSPLTQGKHHNHHEGNPSHGLIPAHAGKTCSPPRRTAACWAHPHSRGENLNEAVTKIVDKGSSPLTRGKRSRRHREVFARRLIPAHAGKTVRTVSESLFSPAHPRSRRENVNFRPPKIFLDGSSPLTQGKRCMILPTGRPVRLIPAHAGKTEARTRTQLPRRAHPRSREENRPCE